MTPERAESIAFMPGASDSSWRAAAEAIWSNGRRRCCVDDTWICGEEAVDFGGGCTKAAAADGLKTFAGVSDNNPVVNIAESGKNLILIWLQVYNV